MVFNRAVIILAVLVALVAVFAACAEEDAGRLAAIEERGKVVCANNDSLAGFGFLDDAGNTVGFDVDLCRAVAAAVLGNANAVEFRATTAAERGPSMQSGDIDMMSRNTTWTTSRDSTWGNFAQTMFYDGQGFMVNKDLGISSALELQDATVCVTQGTTTELNLEDFNRQNELNMNVVTFGRSKLPSQPTWPGSATPIPPTAPF
jgi:general L-amino acid transport system substrate-binding protein